MTSHKLVIAEKLSVAITIGKALNIRKRQDGYIEGNGYIISWCIGHLEAPTPLYEYDNQKKKSDVSYIEDATKSCDVYTDMIKYTK